MRFSFKKPYFFNLKQIPNYSNEQKRKQRLLIINYFFVFSIPVIILNDLVLAISGKQAYTFEKYPVLVFWFICLFALYMTSRKKYLISKLIIIFVPLIFITSYALTGYIIGEHFLWQPIMVLGISIIPFLVLDYNKEKIWLLVAFISFFIYIIFHDDIMLSGAEDSFARVFIRLNTTPFIYNAVRILFYIFLTSIVYYSVRINDYQHVINERINDSLLKTSKNLEFINSELQAQRNTINKSASLIVTDEDKNIVSVNENFLLASGFSNQELVGLDISKFLLAHYDDHIIESILKKLESGKVWRGELRLKKKDGSYFWMETAVSYIEDPEKRHQRILVVMFNITKLKEDEERLERLNHEKDRILYAVAHDLKNPLLNFKALLDMLTSGKVKKADEEEIYRLMTKDCDHSTNLIAELLEIGRLEDNDYILTKTKTDLNVFLEKSIDRFEKQALVKDIKVIKTFDEDLKSISINEREFVRVIYNLISNAIKFTPAGGEIKVSTKFVDNDRVSIEISDTGVGISQNLLPIIFDKFSKASRAGIEGEKSTGLGMWIVKHIVSLHGGEISVASKEKQGTTFTIQLPR